MSAPKHTPGTWMPHHSKGRLYVETHHDDVICMVARGIGTPEDKANASLIAAAPDLLEKCKKIVSWLDKLADQSEESAKDRRFVSLSDAHQADAKNYRATADDIRAVIAKATGGEA